MQRLMILSLPFEESLHAWVRGCSPPGTPSIFFLAERLAARGTEVLWLMFDWSGPLPPGGSVQKRGAITIRIIAKPTRAVAKYLDGSERGFVKRFFKPVDLLFHRDTAWNIAKRFRPQGIYSVGVYSLLGTPLARRLRVPAITRMLGVFLGGHLDSWWKPANTWNEIATLLLKPDFLIITNDGTRGDRVADRFGISREKFWFPINGSDSQILPLPGDRERARQRIGVTPADPVIVSIGRLVAWKRMESLITAFANATAGGRRTARLLIAGDGPERTALTDMATRLGVDHSVEFLGTVPRGAMREYLAAADIAAFAYDHSNVGSALLEAMCAGKPILSVANGDTPRFVKHGVSGLLASEHDRDHELCDYMSRLIQDADLRSRLGDGAAAWAAENLLPWPERMDQECSLLEDLVRQHQSRVARSA